MHVDGEALHLGCEWLSVPGGGGGEKLPDRADGIGRWWKLSTHDCSNRGLGCCWYC